MVAKCTVYCRAETVSIIRSCSRRKAGRLLSFLCMNEEKLHNSKIILHVFTFPYLRMSPKLMTETSNCNKIFKTHFLFAPVYFENRARERTVIQQVLDLKKEK